MGIFLPFLKVFVCDEKLFESSDSNGSCWNIIFFRAENTMFEKIAVQNELLAVSFKDICARSYHLDVIVIVSHKGMVI